MATHRPGEVVWVDLTVPDADDLRSFYEAVVGWTTEAVDMGGYADFNLMPSGSTEATAGLCNARGLNQDLPAAWLVYVTVADLDASLAQCTERGGTVLHHRKGDEGSLAVIRDPAGAVLALYEVSSGA